MRLTRRRLAATLALAVTLPLISVTTAAEASTPSWSLPPGPLPLGPANLTETRTEQRLAPGVTLTTITRGYNDSAHEYWTIGVNIPVGPVKPDPDPDALDKANAVAEQLRETPSVAQDRVLLQRCACHGVAHQPTATSRYWGLPWEMKEDWPA